MNKKKGYIITFVVLLMIIVSIVLIKYIHVTGIPDENYCNNTDYGVSVNILSTLGDFYDGEIVIANLTDTPMKNWALYFSYQDEWIRVQNGVVVTVDSGYRLSGVRDAETTIIPAGGKISIPFQARGSVRNLEETKLCCLEEMPVFEEGMQYCVDGENCKVAVTVTNVTEDQYQMNMVVTNTTRETFTDWGLIFSTQDNVQEVINAKQIDSGDSVKLMVGNEEQELPAGIGVEITYQATIQDSADLPMEFALKPLVQINESEEYVVNYTECVLRDTGVVSLFCIKNITNYELDRWGIRFDNSQGVEIKRTVNPDLDWGGMFYKTHINIETINTFCPGKDYLCLVYMDGIIPSDGINNEFLIRRIEKVSGECRERISMFAYGDQSIVTTPDGREYHKNQLQVSTEDGYGLEQAEILAEQYGAVVVGCIGDSLFFFEFIEDKDYEELIELCEQIEAETAVERAYLKLHYYGNADAQVM